MKRELLFLLNSNSSVKDVVDILDKAGRDGLAFFHNNDRELKYVFTDGDIRRALLNGINLNDSIDRLIQIKKDSKKPNFIFANFDETKEDLIRKMDFNGIRQIIVINQNTNEIIEVIHKEDLVISSYKTTNTAVLIMAGGFGRRLLPYTIDTPKPMLKISGKPFLEYQIESLIASGFKDFYLSVYYLKDIIKEHFKNGDKWGVKITYLEENDPLGTAGCISLIEEKKFDSLIIINGDIYCPLDYQNLVEFHHHNFADITMCVKEFKYQIPYGTITTDGLNLLKIEEKPYVNNFINAGIYVVKKNILEKLIPHVKKDITELIEESLQDHASVKCYPIIFDWIDMGTPKDFELVKEKLNSLSKSNL
jgi:dTDP-glucose pyrophosphorylase